MKNLTPSQVLLCKPHSERLFFFKCEGTYKDTLYFKEFLVNLFFVKKKAINHSYIIFLSFQPSALQIVSSNSPSIRPTCSKSNLVESTDEESQASSVHPWPETSSSSSVSPDTQALNLCVASTSRGDQPSRDDEGQPMVCMICEDRATGLHYGIITCEG